MTWLKGSCTKSECTSTNLLSIAVHPTQHVIDTKISHQHRQESQYDIDMQEYWTAKRWQ